MMVCLTCGTACAESKARGWVHTDQVPREVKEHEVVPVSADDYANLKEAAVTLTPLVEARVWASKVREQMTREEMQGVHWDDGARHAVTLLTALEKVEMRLLGGR